MEDDMQELKVIGSMWHMENYVYYDDQRVSISAYNRRTNYTLKHDNRACQAVSGAVQHLLADVSAPDVTNCS